mmetsp:Transcript_807/g.3682  ORF Transcript_807/g.3682 Transcript_807/m.3682 type:complete len:207 (+) Transcript_807:940-1560(+)
MTRNVSGVTSSGLVALTGSLALRLRLRADSSLSVRESVLASGLDRFFLSLPSLGFSGGGGGLGSGRWMTRYLRSTNATCCSAGGAPASGLNPTPPSTTRACLPVVGSYLSTSAAAHRPAFSASAGETAVLDPPRRRRCRVGLACVYGGSSPSSTASTSSLFTVPGIQSQILPPTRASHQRRYPASRITTRRSTWCSIAADGVSGPA